MEGSPASQRAGALPPQDGGEALDQLHSAPACWRNFMTRSRFQEWLWPRWLVDLFCFPRFTSGRAQLRKPASERSAGSRSDHRIILGKPIAQRYSCGVMP